MTHKLRMGMVGGGEGAFIGPVHRMAAELDGEIELVCGAFSSNPERSMRSGRELYNLPPERCYPDYQNMLADELLLPADRRMDFVTIVTPNHSHFPVASAVLAAGFPIVCDKPLTHRLADAVELAEKVTKSGLLFALTHNYSGYPMVREARALLASGELGALRRVACEYLQGWLAQPEEQDSNKQAQWRTDPAQAGVAGCFGDIGSHAQHLVEFVTDQKISALCADLSTFVEGRRVDDDGNVLLRFSGGARGVLSASQIAVGEENALVLRVYCERGSLTWSQEEPNSLVVRWPDRAYETRRTGGSGLHPGSVTAARLPAGHPEGYLEAFANLYRAYARALRQQRAKLPPVIDFPTIAEGVRGMQFIETVVASSRQGGQWLTL